MTLQGEVYMIGDTQTFGTNGFRKRELVINTNEQYRQKILIEFVQDNCVKLDDARLGMNIEVSINIRGREWQNPEGEVRFFNSIQGWKFTILDESAPEPVQESSNEPVGSSDEDDDLPF